MQRCFGNLPEFHGWGVVETGFKPSRSCFSIFTLGQHTDPSAPSSILFAPPCNHPGPRAEWDSGSHIPALSLLSLTRSWWHHPVTALSLQFSIHKVATTIVAAAKSKIQSSCCLLRGATPFAWMRLSRGQNQKSVSQGTIEWVGTSQTVGSTPFGKDGDSQGWMWAQRFQRTGI